MAFVREGDLTITSSRLGSDKPSRETSRLEAHTADDKISHGDQGLVDPF